MADEREEQPHEKSSPCPDILVALNEHESLQRCSLLDKKLSENCISHGLGKECV